MMTAPRRSTVALVAERAGVSIASVSRVLNDQPASEGVITRVRLAAKELGYVADATARSLKVGRTEQIALAVADVGNPVYVSMMRAVSDVIVESGYRLVLSSTGSDAQSQIDLLASLNRGFADGLILIPLRVTDDLVRQLTDSPLPMVVIGSLPDGVDIDNVRADSAQGMVLALEHLDDIGRHSVAFVNGPVDTVPGAARLRGFTRARQQFGLQDAGIVEADDFTYEAGLIAARQLLTNPGRAGMPDAVVCANDLLAVAVNNVAAELGLRVPSDIAVVGMDDSQVARLAQPSLTSVNLGADERARVAASLLISRLADRSLPARRVVVPPTLTIRASTTI